MPADDIAEIRTAILSEVASNLETLDFLDGGDVGFAVGAVYAAAIEANAITACFRLEDGRVVTARFALVNLEVK
jgi:hypothetical protein